MVRLWNRLVGMDEMRLPKFMFLVNINHNLNWAKSIEKIFDECGMFDTFLNCDKCELNTNKTKLQEADNFKFREEVVCKPKLRLFKELKDTNRAICNMYKQSNMCANISLKGKGHYLPSLDVGSYLWR